MMERSGIFSQTVVRTVLFNGGVPLIEPRSRGGVKGNPVAIYLFFL